jgi:hypothetical protein
MTLLRAAIALATLPLLIALPGAAFSQADANWWSLQTVTRPELPAVKDRDWPRNPIDHFVLAKLEAAKLRPAPEADARTLSRRLHFDLVGLPPEPDAKADIDALLASQHYGERWARHWLDVARFGESQGFEFDQLREHAWPYRDWVINAFNDDMPYDRFVRLQIAGDRLEPGNADAITATSFLVCGSFDGLKPKGDKQRKIMRQDEMEDLVGTVSQSFLGLTVNCARCHDHKFDPITQKEYFQIASALAGVHRGDRKVSAGGDPSVLKKIYAVTPKKAPVTQFLTRGSPFEPAGDVAAGGIASVASSLPAEFGLKPDAPDEQRRTMLAEWITHPDNPLFARVMMNRLWHYHFGQGLVKTPNDLGFSGGEASHPQLLDWLAAEFRASGWSLKKMHRQICDSATYRQSSQHNPQAQEIDASNVLLWRHTPSRLEAEAIRDSILKVSGQFNPQMGGPGFRDFKMYKHKGSWFYDPIDPEGAEFNRRSIYRTWARGNVHPLLAPLDCPDPSSSAPARSVTTTPLGALALMNTSFVLRMSDHFAARLEAEAGDDIHAQVYHAYQLALARRPRAEELELTHEFIKNNGLPAFCRVIFNTNEFLYVN